MTDLEITKFCAEAIGLEVTVYDDITYFKGEEPPAECYPGGDFYDPLHDDAQAMALVKRFRLGIVMFHDKLWSVNDRRSVSTAADLNRAICECVAKMQQAKGK